MKKRKGRDNWKEKYKDKLYRNREWMYEKYMVEHRTVRWITAHSGARTHKTVLEWCRRFGFPKRTLRVLVTKEELYDLYIEKNMTQAEVCSFLNLGFYVVIRHLKLYQIKKARSSYVSHFKGAVFSEEHKQKLREARKGKKPFLGCSHSEQAKRKMRETKRKQREQSKLFSL